MGTAVSGWRAVDISGGGESSKWLNQDGLGKFLADAESRIANLADEVRIPRKQSNLLFLAESQLSEPIAHFRGSGELLDTNHRAGLHLAQWAKR
jgi:hypothetical protein